MRSDPDPRMAFGSCPLVDVTRVSVPEVDGSRSRSDIADRANRSRDTFVSGSGPRIDEFMELSRDVAAMILGRGRTECSQLAQSSS